MENLHDNLADIQGLLIYGFGRLRHADYFILHTGGETGQTQNWLKTILPEIATAQEEIRRPCYSLAFGKSGLEKLGWAVNEKTGFSRAFIEGMDTEHRHRILGDYDDNDTKNWQWGSRNHPPADMLLISFATSEDELIQRRTHLKKTMQENRVEVVHEVLDTYLETKEHFGFQDGISQPVIRDSGRTEGENDVLNSGEFVFGYPNEYNKLPQAPNEIGKNGSYLVFRQLEQKVKTFWDYLLSQSSENSVEEAIYLAAKMVGRWPNGSPITLTDNPEDSHHQKSNKFGYYPEDRWGRKCPLGAHIRRTNPRDSVEENPTQSLKASRKHRILRRGRAYGKPLSENYDIEEIIKNAEDGESRGLNFICFNTDIERQFEFVQHTWCNNEKFDGLYEEVDPISGVRGNGTEFRPSHYKIPELPFRRRLTNVPPFVFMKGGAYFFFPALSAIQRLINHT
jgi:Dyp-type peroxidase family